MSQTVIIANQDAYEAGAITTALAPSFDAQHVADTAALLEKAESALAVVLDTNFSEAQGIDVLMEVLAHATVPVLMITPDTEPACAVEAMRCGAAGYLVKTASYVELLPTAVNEAIQRARANEDIKREINELRKRNAELEKQVKMTRLKTPGPTLPAADSSEMAMEEIVAERIRNGTLNLPTYPRIAIKLRELMQADVGIAEVAQLLAQDAAVSAKLLRVANAAQYNHLRKVETVEGAVSRVGLAVACNIAEVIANRSLYSCRNVAYRAFLDALWEHSIACAHASDAIGRLLGRSSLHKLFTLGLLHDVGRLALVQAVAQSDPNGKCIEGEEKQKSFEQFLRKHNAHCGAVLMQRWGFDQDFVEIACYHRDITVVEKPSRALMIVSLGNHVARAIGYGRPFGEDENLEQSTAKGYLFPGDADLSQVTEEVHRAMEHTRAMLA